MTATLTNADAELVTAITATRQIATLVLLSCGCGVTVDGVHEKGTLGRCMDCVEYVTVNQAFPVLDI